MRTFAKLLLAFMLVGTMPVIITGCAKKGPAEEAGEKIDNAAAEAADAAEDAADAAKEALGQ